MILTLDLTNVPFDKWADLIDIAIDSILNCDSDDSLSDDDN